MSTTYRHASYRCPTCDYKMDASMAAPDNCQQRGPMAGDFSVCMCCGEILVYQSDLSVKMAGVNDMLFLDPQISHTLDRTQKLIRKMRVVKRK